jgi:hypothetical protein
LHELLPERTVFTASSGCRRSEVDPDAPNWKLIDEASRHLTSLGQTPFSRLDIYRLIWRDHPERQRASLDPTFQGMVSNASGGPASAWHSTAAGGAGTV